MSSDLESCAVLSPPPRTVLRAAVTGQTGIRCRTVPVLLVFPSRSDESAAILQGVAHYERTNPAWITYLDDHGRSELDPRWLRTKAWAGVISQSTTPALVRACAELALPLVDLGNTPGPSQGVCRVRPDNRAVGHVGAEYFMERGYHHFAFCGYEGAPWSAERRDGFVEALALAGRGCSLVDIAQPGDGLPFWDDAAAEALIFWVRCLPRRCAVMACNDLCALQILRAAQAAGVLVPEQLGVLGANNDVLRCELSNPPISSVDANCLQAGYAAAEYLNGIIAGDRAVALQIRIEPLGVVTRKSTDGLAVGDSVVAKALSFIGEHACRGVTVEEVLRHVLVSRSKLESRFRRHVGRSPQAEIRRVQLERITQLLVETNLPLCEIAEQTGFVHPEYMCVLFKRVTGEAPGRFRRKHQAQQSAV